MELADDGVTNTISVSLTAQTWFAVVTQAGTSWDDLNGNYRYSYDGGLNEGSFQLAKSGNAMALPAGDWTISINSNTMQMTLKRNTPAVMQPSAVLLLLAELSS